MILEFCPYLSWHSRIPLRCVLLLRLERLQERLHFIIGLFSLLDEDLLERVSNLCLILFIVEDDFNLAIFLVHDHLDLGLSLSVRLLNLLHHGFHELLLLSVHLFDLLLDFLLHLGVGLLDNLSDHLRLLLSRLLLGLFIFGVHGDRRAVMFARDLKIWGLFDIGGVLS